MEMILPCLYAALGCMAFCFIFQLRKWRYILCAALCGAAGWLVYLLLDGMGITARFLMATITIALLAEVFARVFKTPATVFLIIGIIPLVPGGGIYYTMEHAMSGETSLFLESLLHTLGMAGALAVGVLMVSSLARLITTYQNRRHGRIGGTHP